MTCSNKYFIMWVGKENGRYDEIDCIYNTLNDEPFVVVCLWLQFVVLSGATTIRAYGLQQTFEKESEDTVDMNQMCYYPGIIANRFVVLLVAAEFFGNGGPVVQCICPHISLCY
ncbi:hypothetical protein PR048_019034 [Dryococelus australis]|uniref:Uncharacterized protein n=1 Tax=Dryococelus australis TaxID=614101 RepID=A0ABQ9H2E6_9NEOP|nr:hypothetical protein PR048_019034 [Dryococelus australis]